MASSSGSKKRSSPEVIDVDDPNVDYTPDVHFAGVRMYKAKVEPIYEQQLKISSRKEAKRVLVVPADPSKNRRAQVKEVHEILDSSEDEGGPSNSKAIHNSSPASSRQSRGPTYIPGFLAPSGFKKVTLDPASMDKASMELVDRIIERVPAGAKIHSSASLGLRRPAASLMARHPQAGSLKGKLVATSSSKHDIITIDISDDDEDEANSRPTDPAKDETDSDVDYNNYHAALDIDNPRNWNHQPRVKDTPGDVLEVHNSSRGNEATASEAAVIALRAHFKRSKARSTRYVPRSQFPQELRAADSNGRKYLWTSLREAVAQMPEAYATSPIDGKWRLEELHGPVSNFRNLRKTVHKHLTPGPINTISQHSGMISVASCVLGEDATTDGARVYNQEASLKVLYGDRVMSLEGHVHLSGQSRYRTVNDAHFDPTTDEDFSHRLVSCGQDGKVILWNCKSVVEDEQGEPVIVKEFRYMKDCIPLGALYKPEGSVFAVWCSDGSIRIHKNDLKYGELKVAPRTDPQPIQSVAWGRESTNGILFATSGSDHWNTHKGVHKAFDVEKCKVVHTIDNEGSGECLDISSRGNEIALATRCEDQQFNLSIYDVREKSSRRPAQHVALSRLKPWFDDADGDPSVNRLPSRINQVLYSPDSVLIAVARSDNVSHVYDSRFLDRILYKFYHKEGIEGTFDDTKFGVYKVDWVVHPLTGRLSLVSSGADGCVRLWDTCEKQTRRRYDSGAVIAESDAYVSWHSLGDITKGEKPLVMGDGSGTLVIRD